MVSKPEKYVQDIIQKYDKASGGKFGEFVALLRVQNLSAQTIYNYLSKISLFLQWCLNNNKDFSVVTKRQVYMWASGFDNPRTRSLYMISVKKYWKTLDDKRYENFKVPKYQLPQLPDVLTEKEVLALADACDNIRDKALIYTV